MISKVKNDLFDYKNRYIMQMRDGFKFSLDSLLLAEFVKVKKDWRNKDNALREFGFRNEY